MEFARASALNPRSKGKRRSFCPLKKRALKPLKPPNAGNSSIYVSSPINFLDSFKLSALEILEFLHRKIIAIEAVFGSAYQSTSPNVSFFKSKFRSLGILLREQMCEGCGMNCRQQEFDQSAQGKAARAQIAAMAKQSANPSRGEPVLKVITTLTEKFERP